MELDDFRESWKQSTPDGAGPGEAALQTLLAQGSTGPVARMLRNARRESVTTAFSLGLSTVGLLWASWLQPFWLLLLANSLVMGCYYYQKIRVLRRLGTSTGAFRSHLERQLLSLRSLLRLNYSFTMLTLLVTLSFLLYWVYTHAPQLFQGDPRTLWQRGVWLVLTVTITCILVHWITRYHLRHLYGQHLDRLEGYLHELQAE